MGAAPTWRDEAACKGMDTAIWYPEGGQRNDEAKAICDGCPVEAACLEAAVARREDFGVWGGRSEKERRPRPRRGPPNRHDSTRPGPQAMELSKAMELSSAGGVADCATGNWTPVVLARRAS
jgi:WhiB family redox-sensing transcriptional regulator